MKAGLPFDAVIQQVLSLKDAKRDYILSPQQIYFDGGKMQINSRGLFDINKNCHRQLGNYLDIPSAYYNRIQEGHPDLWEVTLNRLMSRSAPGDRRMVRAYDNGEKTARAFLSNRYRRIDNVDLLLKSILPVIAEDKSLEVVSSNVDDDKLFLKVVSRERIGEVKVGEPVRAGFLVRNSEVGLGTFEASSFIETLRCTNGMVIEEYSQKRRHVGKVIDCDYEIFQDDTMRADDNALLLKARDQVKAVLQQSVFDGVLAKMKRAAGIPVVDPVREVEELRNFGVTDEEIQGILNHFAKGGDSTRWGYISAITRAAEDADSYDRATELERLGGQLLVTN